jgi:hypothetical protein
MDNDRINPGASLCLKYASDGEGIAGISSKAVHRFSRKGYQSAPSNYFRGLSDGFFVRRVKNSGRSHEYLLPRKAAASKSIIEVYDPARSVTIFFCDSDSDGCKKAKRTPFVICHMTNDK